MVQVKAAVRGLRCLTIPQIKQKAVSCLIFLHGSCDTGIGLKITIDELLSEDLRFPRTKVVYPTAPRIPLPTQQGVLRNSWFKHGFLLPCVPENTESINDMCARLSVVIESEISYGIPESRIIVGGYNVGGIIAMHVAYKLYPKLSGVFAMSAFLQENSEVFKAVRKNLENPPLLLIHGIGDRVARHRWSLETHLMMKTLGVRSELCSVPNMGHELTSESIRLLKEWISSNKRMDTFDTLEAEARETIESDKSAS